jgi:hypothetical protein
MTVHVAIGGTEYTEVLLDSLTVSEQIGRPAQARFTIEDMSGALVATSWLPTRLADVRIWDTAETGDLFRGQVTLARAWAEGVRRVLEVEAESYDRLLDYTLVGTHLEVRYHVTQPWMAGWTFEMMVSGEWKKPYWVDVSANTGIAYPANDDASVVDALFAEYWLGPTLTWDVTSYGIVDQPSPDAAPPHEVEGRNYFDMTSLRDALDRTASLVSSNLAFWIDADLVFHWQVLASHTWVGNPDIPTGSERHTLVRMLPEFRDPTWAPYGMVTGATDAVTGVLTIEVAGGGAVDGVYVRAASADASGYVAVATDGTDTGARAFIEAPWVTSHDELPTAVTYASPDLTQRRTYTMTTAGPWTGIHVGQSMTIWNPTLGITDATTQAIVANEMRFLPDGSRTYALQLGDGAIRTMTANARASRRKAQADQAREPANINERAYLWAVNLGDVAARPGDSQKVTAQYTDNAGKPLPIAGLTLEWGLTIKEGATGTPYNVDPSSATDTSYPFYLSAQTSITAQDGRAENLLTTNTSASTDDTCVVWVALR